MGADRQCNDSVVRLTKSQQSANIIIAAGKNPNLCRTEYIMKKYYIDLIEEKCAIYEIEEKFMYGAKHTVRTKIADGGLEIMSENGYYPIKAGGAVSVPCVEETKDGLQFYSALLYEAKRVGFTFSVKYHEDGIYYEFDPALEITNDEDETELREYFTSQGFKFEVYFGYDGKKRAKVSK